MHQDLPFQTHQWQQHQQVVTQDHHFHHQTEQLQMKRQKAVCQSNNEPQKHQRVQRNLNQQQSHQRASYESQMVTTQTKKGVEITAYTCDDVTKQQTEKILLEPMVNNTEGLDKQKTSEGMKNEIDAMKKQQVYVEVDIDTLTPEQRKNIIQSQWVLRDKGNNVRARIVAKGYTETVNDLLDIYASEPNIFM
jgi:hypothetical protein